MVLLALATFAIAGLAGSAVGAVSSPYLPIREGRAAIQTRLAKSDRSFGSRSVITGCWKPSRPRVDCSYRARADTLCFGTMKAWLSSSGNTLWTKGTSYQCQPVAAPQPTGPYFDVGGGHWIRSVSIGGKTITLEDGSIWLINPLDRLDTMLWLPIDDITVLTSGGIYTYTYTLVNTDEGETAHAQYLGR